MSDRGAPHIFKLIALGAIVWIAAFWLWPTKAPVDEDNVRVTRDPAPMIPAEPGNGGGNDASPADPSPDPPGGRDADDAPKNDTPDDPDPDRATDPDVRDADGDGVEEPVYRIHIVAPGGETLQQISRKYYGTYDKWRAIARANGHSVDPNRLLPGTEVKVPRDPENVQGVPVDPDDDDDGADEEPETQYTEYIVSRNDSLWTIAKALYGSGTRWTVIRDANRDLVGEEGQKLRPGMVLKIPPPPGG